MPCLRRITVVACLVAITMTDSPTAQPRRIYWGDEVPAGWTGKWPSDLLTVPERTQWTRTMSTLQLHEWIAALKLKTEYLHVETMFISPLRKAAPVMVLANPRVTSPAAGAGVGQAGRVPARQHPSAGVGSGRGDADAGARSRRRQAPGTCSTTSS